MFLIQSYRYFLNLNSLLWFSDIYVALSFENDEIRIKITIKVDFYILMYV